MPTIPNLDALIRREDFDVVPTGSFERREAIDASALERDHFVFSTLRKPDFQRETAHWTTEKILELIRSFIDGDLIPALILWPAGNNLFVIDGAHRLSAIIAWVNDDYGDGPLSTAFYGISIADDQKRAADKTRKMIKSEIGSFADYQALIKKPDPSKPEMNARASRLGQRAIKVQWVEGDSKKAEESFYRINLSATPIDDTELSMIRARHKPNALATRAIIRAGSGHKYWSGFETGVQESIEEIAEELFDLLCNPPYVAPIKTLDLPAAGSGYSPETVRLIYDFVNYLHGLRADMWLDKSKRTRGIPGIRNQSLADDIDGSETMAYLKKVKAVTKRITGKHPGSLGLHPAVYFYGATGNIQPTAFLAVASLIIWLEKTDGFEEFTRCRGRFEDFIVSYRHFINQISANIGAGLKGLEPLTDMYKIILREIAMGSTDEQIIIAIKANDALSFIREISDEDRKHGRNFSKETKNSAFMKQALAVAMRCPLCNARLHVKSISDDHILRKADGGDGSPENLQHTHFYCNTTYKN